MIAQDRKPRYVAANEGDTSPLLMHLWEGGTPTELRTGMVLKLIPNVRKYFMEPLHHVVKRGLRIHFIFMKPFHRTRGSLF